VARSQASLDDDAIAGRTKAAHHSAMGEEELTIPLQVKTGHRYAWMGITAVWLAGALAWTVVRPSVASVAFGIVTIGLLAWIWAFVFAMRRCVAPRLVVTREAISSPQGTLRWDRVQSLSIGTTPAGSLRALFIEPIQPSDVQLPPSRILRLNRLFSEWAEGGRLTVLEANLDRPVEQLMLDLEPQAGRELPAEGG
jgi:hypothetical protein